MNISLSEEAEQTSPEEIFTQEPEQDKENIDNQILYEDWEKNIFQDTEIDDFLYL